MLTQLVATQGEINRLRQREAALGQERTRLGEDQNRARENLKVLRDTPSELEMRKKYLAQIDRSEARLEAINEEGRQAATQRQQLEAELSKKVQDYKEE